MEEKKITINININSNKANERKSDELIERIAKSIIDNLNNYPPTPYVERLGR